MGQAWFDQTCHQQAECDWHRVHVPTLQAVAKRQRALGANKPVLKRPPVSRAGGRRRRTRQRAKKVMVLWCCGSGFGQLIVSHGPRSVASGAWCRRRPQPDDSRTRRRAHTAAGDQSRGWRAPPMVEEAESGSWFPGHAAPPPCCHRRASALRRAGRGRVAVWRPLRLQP